MALDTKLLILFTLIPLWVNGASLISSKIRSKASEINGTSWDLRNLKLTGKDLSGICKFLTENRQVTSLDLSDNDFHGIDEIQLLIESLNNTIIKHLKLRNTNLGNSRLGSLTRSLPETNLTSIDLSDNKFNEIDLQRFIKILDTSKITELILSNNKITDRLSESLAQVLEKRKINRINLNDNVMGPGSRKLLNTLIDKDIEFSIDGNQLGDAGAEMLINKLKERRKTSFTLRRNGVGPAGCLSIAKALKHSDFTALDLSGNDLGELGSNVIAYVLQFTKIHSLYLNHINSDLINFLYQLDLTLQANVSSLHLFSPKLVSSYELINKMMHFMNTNILSLIIPEPFDSNSSKLFADLISFESVKDLFLHFPLYFPYSLEKPKLSLILFSNLGLESLRIHAKEVNMTELTGVLLKMKISCLGLTIKIWRTDETEILSNALEHTTVNWLDLSSSELNEEALEILMKGLVKSDVTTFEFRNDFHNVENTITIMRVLNKYLNITKIKSLNLNNHQLNRYQETITFINTLPSTNIKQLELESVNMFNDEFERLTEVLNATEIVQLKVKYNKIDNGGVKALADVLCQTKIVDLEIIPQLVLINDTTSLGKIEKCLEENRAKLGGNMMNKFSKPLIKLNKLHLEGNLEASIYVIPQMIKKLNLTELVASILDVSDPQVMNLQMKDALKANEVLLTLNVTGNHSEVDYYLNRNRKTFNQAKSVIRRYERGTIEQCSDDDFNAFQVFCETINLWEHRKDRDHLKNEILSKIQQIKTVRKGLKSGNTSGKCSVNSFIISVLLLLIVI